MLLSAGRILLRYTPSVSQLGCSEDCHSFSAALCRTSRDHRTRGDPPWKVQEGASRTAPKRWGREAPAIGAESIVRAALQNLNKFLTGGEECQVPPIKLKGGHET
jgi:hypothetical protein